MTVYDGIDIEKRFPKTTLKEAYERSKRTERWVFHETVCSSLTLIYGKSNVGKSYLVASMLLSLLIKDREFLGMQPTDMTKLWKPAILWTDPGSDDEYGDRIGDHLPDGVEVEVPMFHVGRTTDPREWNALVSFLLSEGFNFVVLDNLMGATGDTNQPADVTTVLDGLTRLISSGVPVVVLHHESEHGGSNPGGAPMGASGILQKSRMWVQVRQSAKRKMRGGNTVLVIQGNALKQPQQLVAEPLTGPAYRLLNRGPWGHDEDKPKRSPAAADLNARAAAWVIDNCQGSGLNKAAKRLAEEFPERTSETWRDQLMRGALSKLLARDGDDASTSWKAT